MTKKTLTAAMLALLGATSLYAEKIVESPNGRLAVDLTVENGTPRYQVLLDGQTYIQPSALGLVTNIGEIATKGMEDYIAEVKSGAFPAPEHKYKFTGDKDEFAAFLAEYEKELDL